MSPTGSGRPAAFEQTRRDGLLAARLLDDLPEALDLIEYHRDPAQDRRARRAGRRCGDPDDAVTALPLSGSFGSNCSTSSLQYIRKNRGCTIYLGRPPPLLCDALLQSGRSLRLNSTPERTKSRGLASSARDQRRTGITHATFPFECPAGARCGPGKGAAVVPTPAQFPRTGMFPV